MDDLIQLLQRSRLRLVHFLGAVVQRFLGARGEQRRSLAGKARALRRQLKAGGKPRNVLAAEIDHDAAEVTQHHAGSSRNSDGHAGNHGESGQQAAPDTKLRETKSKKFKLADLEAKHHRRGPAPLPEDEQSARSSIMPPG
ncbi:hypothetical protein [Bradyrhizobium sp. AUGA SZCCT0042]|uniref:hypothetical protein n=1 Tax=Bradyrhizobium sp. AUGA SZCCT0042 TaxID=2807651 RepID=UPI002011F6E4|nr:hypothetical protein [Bradyrhizobium sp. AUGA SZCCT0042]